MMLNFYHPTHSIRGPIRRAIRTAKTWVREEGPAFIVICFILAGMTVQFFNTIGRVVSDPAAAPSTSPRPTSSISSLTTGYDPVVAASRVDHGQLSFRSGE